jgi:hypothetical protein
MTLNALGEQRAIPLSCILDGEPRRESRPDAVSLKRTR